MLLRHTPLLSVWYLRVAGSRQDPRLRWSLNPTIPPNVRWQVGQCAWTRFGLRHSFVHFMATFHSSVSSPASLRMPSGPDSR